MKTIRNWYWRKFKLVPHPEEISDCVWRVLVIQNRIYDVVHSPRYDIALEYIHGTPISDISIFHGLPTTRIKAVLWKIWTEASNVA